MARDIEEFLRRAAERRRQQQQKKQGGAAQAKRVREVIEQQDIEIVQPVEIVYAEEAEPEPRRTLVQKTQDLRTQSVAEHVRTHIDSRDIAAHAEHLGDDIQRVDDQVAARLKRKFNHDVGHLDDLPTVQDDQVATVTQEGVSDVVAGLVQMMRSPKSVRQAILISEILKRPSFDD